MFCLSYIKTRMATDLARWMAKSITDLVTYHSLCDNVADFSAGIARDLPIGVDLDHSRMSRGLTRYFDASPTMAVTAQYTDRADGDRALRGGDIYALVVLPDSLEKTPCWDTRHL